MSRNTPLQKMFRGITVEPWKGVEIGQCCKEALALANLTGLPVAFKFNDFKMEVQPGEDLEAFWQRWEQR